MKPEDLKAPFSWEKRQVAIQDRVWYVPCYYNKYQDFSFPGWNHQKTFLTHQPVKVEYCSGNGSWIAAKALDDPFTNWVAVEMLFERARKIWAKIKNYDLHNLLTVCAEGQTVTEHYFPSESVTEVFINFPDPWPKRRHTKNRIIQPEFVEEIWRILRPGCQFTFVTDDRDYSKWTIGEMAKHPGFQSLYPDPYYVVELPNYGTSYFEELWRSKGKMIYYHQFQKIERT